LKNKNTYLVITPFFPSDDSFVGSYIFDQINHIRIQSGFNIEVVKVTSIFSLEQDYHFKEFKVRIFKTIDFPYFILPGIFNWINKFRFRYFLKRKAIEDIKVSHSHVTYPCSYLVEGLDCKKITQHHGLDVLQLLNGRNRLIREIQRNFLIRNSIKHINSANLNVGVSALVLEQLRDYKGYVPVHEYVLYNGVDTSKFFDTRRDKKNNVFTIGCVANFVKSKGQQTLIRSVQEILESGRMIRLRFIGSGPTLDSCQEYVLTNNLSTHISFESEIAHEELNNFYNSLDLFVLPSYYEALGCVYLEAWAANTPFIGVRGQGISELVTHQENMLFEANNIEDLKGKICYFMDNNYTLASVGDLDIKKTISQFLSLELFRNHD
tara:strand:- start:17877 stop:19013 length:1137 start_codon:yes stop_codon:yes gene_type:complete